MRTNIFVILLVVIVIIGCETENDFECECKTNTIHLIGENNCKAEKKCLCEHDIAGQRASNGIAITNRYELETEVFNKIIGYINVALANQVLNGTIESNAIKNNINEIKVFSVTGIAKVENNIVFVYRNTSEIGFRTALETWLWDEGYITE